MAMPPLLRLLLFGSASRIALRLAHGARFADVALRDLNIVLLLLMLWTQLSPPGSTARRWTRFASGVVIFSIPFAIDSDFFGYPILKTMSLGIVTLYILGSLYELIFH